jgi:hypothetical protein
VLQQFPASWRINGSLVIVQDFWVPTCSNKPWSLKVAKNINIEEIHSSMLQTAHGH